MRWWGTLFLIGAAAFPLTSLLFPRWHDKGYLFSKAVGMAIVTWIVFISGMAHIAPFANITISVAVSIVFFGGALGHITQKPNMRDRKLFGIIVAEEVFFFAALLFWSWVKAHEPSIRGLEKFMDYGFMNSILHSRYFPPVDMWYPPYSINYYYFGHLTTAVLTRLSGLDLGYTFNLMLATIFALCLTMSFSIGYAVIGMIKGIRGAGKVVGAILTAWLVTLAGNMQTIYAFTRGYSGDAVQPFWKLFWPLSDVLSKYPEGLARYWYANATRFIPYTIHEFPSYSFVVSDVHGHVLSIPFVLLAIALLMTCFVGVRETVSKRVRYASAEFWNGSLTPFMLLFYGFLTGILLMTNALDGPIYLGLFLMLLLVLYPGDWSERDYWVAWGKRAGIVLLAAGISSLPFLAHFTSFVNGVAIDCPPALLANSHIGPILFESVEKCQKSPLWMMYLLWGFFWFNGIWLIVTRSVVKKSKGKITLSWQYIVHIWNNNFTQIEKVLVICFVFSTLLIIFPEFFYFKDIYPMHFRSNTMFKLGYQAFILYSILSAYVIIDALRTVRTTLSGKIFLVLLIPQLFLVSIYPWFSVRSYFGDLRTYQGIWGLQWLQTEYPDNFAAIEWLNNEWRVASNEKKSSIPDTRYSNLVEADGDSYTDYDQFSVFAGTPTVIGWAVHEWLWRGSYDVVAPRREDVRKIYESQDIGETRMLLDRYRVRYVIVGTLEHQKYPALQEQKFVTMGREVFRHGETAIYDVSRAK